MTLDIGIENGTDKGFTKKELGLTNGFTLGVICAHAGIGRIGDKAYGVVISAEEAVERFKLVLDTMPLWDDQENTWEYKWLTNLDNMKRLEENDWYCNAGSKSTEQFIHDMKNVMFDYATRETMFKYSPRVSWDDFKSQKETIRSILGMILTGDDKRYYDDNKWMVYDLTAVFEPYDNWDLKKPFYDGKYLVYDEDTDEYKLSKEPQKEDY
jgi:hypothetical protein